jgi:hypothetical protein
MLFAENRISKHLIRGDEGLRTHSIPMVDMALPCHKVQAGPAETLDCWHWPRAVMCLDRSFCHYSVRVLSLVCQRMI